MATPRADLLEVQDILTAHYSEDALAFKIAETLRQVYEIDDYVARIVNEINENMAQMREAGKQGYCPEIARMFELIMWDRYKDIRVAEAGFGHLFALDMALFGFGFDAVISRIEAHYFNDTMCSKYLYFWAGVLKTS